MGTHSPQEEQGAMKRTGLAVCLVSILSTPAFADPVFTDVTRDAGVGDAGNGKGVAFADVDNDGDWDLYVSNKGGANRLYRNNGDGTFTNIAGDNPAVQFAGVDR